MNFCGQHIVYFFFLKELQSMVTNDAIGTVPEKLQELFQPAFDEIQRREEASFNKPHRIDNNFSIDFKPLVDQKYALFTAGTNVLAPRPLDPRYPIFRMYGCFETKEDAKEHAEVIQEMDARCSLLVVKCGVWFLFPQTEEMKHPTDARSQRIEEKLALYRNQRYENDTKFEDMVRNKKSGTPTRWDPQTYTEEEEEQVDAEQTIYKRPKKLRVGAEVRGQNFGVVSTIQDPNGELLLLIVAAFDTEEEAASWINDTGKYIFNMYDLHICKTCEWVYPNGSLDKSGDEIYRNPELDNIMRTAKANPGVVQRYKDWKKQTEANTSFTQIPAV